MTMVKGKDGMTMDNIDLTHAKDIECEKCEHKGFKQTMMLKRLSAIVSPNGQESIVPVMAFTGIRKITDIHRAIWTVSE